MKFLFTNKKISGDLPFLKKNEFNCINLFGYNLVFNEPKSLYENENIYGVVDGYLKDLDIEITQVSLQTLSALSKIPKKWPLPSNITGSFSGFLIDKHSFEISVFTDVIGTYPIYYLFKDECVYISNSLLLIGGFSETEFDQTGIFQKAVGPYFMNIGKRTILKNCKRLLPGECINISKENKLSHHFDNDLYKEINSKDPSSEEFMLSLEKEIKYLLADKKNVHIALSGGLDSRLLLGGIPNEKKLFSHTYGSKNNYENKIAALLTKRKGGKHYDYFQPEAYFPEKRVFEKYIFNTEAVKFPAWLEILENIEKNKEKEVLLIGDMCEALVGRNIKAFTGSKFRKKNYLNFSGKNKNFPFQDVNNALLENWKKQTSAFLLSWHGDNWFRRLDLIDKKDEIIQNTQSDLNDIFDRIASHNIPYIELYDEILGWFTKSRSVMSQQILIANHNFFAVCPTMSNLILKKTSNIDPNSRLHNGYMNRLFKENSELRKLGKVPTSQIPLIPHNSPDLFKLPMWAFRSISDDFFINRILKKRNPELRYRLFKSQNWIEIYQQPGILEKFSSYFLPNALTQNYKNIFFELAQKRQNLESWPFSNIDLISAANINLEIITIRNLKEEIDTYS